MQLLSPNMVMTCALKMRKNNKTKPKKKRKEIKVNRVAVYFRRIDVHTFFTALQSALYQPLSKKGERGMDTLIPEYCNLLVVSGCILQVCRLECKNSSWKGIGAIMTKS